MCERGPAVLDQVASPQRSRESGGRPPVEECLPFKGKQAVVTH